MVLIFFLAGFQTVAAQDFSAQSANHEHQRYTASEIAAYADAAQAVLDYRFIDAKFPLKPQHGSIDTFYIGYPDSVDPPEAFLDCGEHLQVVFLPYSQRRIQDSWDNWRIYLYEIVTADTVRMCYEQDVPLKYEGLPTSPSMAIVLLAKEQAIWHVIRWSWMLRE